jgi:anti-sigma-K factor RskA
MSDDPTTRAASYAAGALTAAERRELERDARRSRRLATEVDEFVETAALLGLAVAPVAPPASARAQLLDAVAGLSQEGTVTRGPWLARPVATALGAAAAVVLVVGGAVAGLQLSSQPSAAQQIVAAADHEQVVIPMDDGGSVTAMWSASLGRAALHIEGMADLPSQHVYQAWLIRTDGHAEPAGTFLAGENLDVTVALAAEMHAGDAIGITMEPAGGSEAPTTEPLLVIPTA